MNINEFQKLSWYMKYQPKTVDEYVFENNEFKNYVLKWIDQNYIDGNILFYGPPGTGKTAISEIIIKSLIKHEYDLKVIKSRSVNQIDELYSWCQTVPVESNKKIVYVEEFDKLSTAAFTTLKDSILEKFQENVSFICNTNFINKIDSGVISRFNYKISLIGNKEKIFDRLEYILKNEKIHYEQDKLKEFVYYNYKKGLRNLITTIQIGSISGILSLDNNVTDTLEENIINLTLKIYSKIYTINNVNNKKLILVDPINSIVSEEYSKILEIVQYNNDINYDYILLEILNRIHFLPIKVLISKYIETFENKKIPYVHYLAFVFESMRSIMELN